MENNQNTTPEYIFTSPNYAQYIIEYNGDFNSAIGKNIGIYITRVNDEYAIVSIREDIIVDYYNINEVRFLLEQYLFINKGFNVVFISSPQVYTLQEISAIEAAQVSSLQTSLPLNLTGKGVIVGVIDTGVDYLNEEFMDSDGKSRIVSIWDQTIESNTSGNELVPFGTVYTNAQINQAIEAHKRGEDPYSIVPSKDENGHGTNMAGIVGASGKNLDIKGVAPECEFVIIKLSEADFIKSKMKLNVPIYSLAFVFVAVEFLRKVLLTQGKPVVVLLPLGSNNGNHKGDNIFNSFIESVSSNIGIVIVTGSGNEALQDAHATGIIKSKNRVESIGLLIAENQEIMTVEFWIGVPNIMDINVVSPTGEETGYILSTIDEDRSYSFVFEKTKAQIYYFLPEEYTGDQLIAIYFTNIQPGLWSLKLRLRQGEMATYNAWILQKGVALPGTRFLQSDAYGTLTIPGDSDFIITVAGYNQNNNSLLPYSGVSFRDESIDKIDFAAGGSNTMTVGLNNSIDVINGTSLSAAIGAGACILLLQWGIVQGNYPYMYVQSIKTFLRRGVIQRPGDVYPNPVWGYGILNFYKIFENMT